jgi:hypothetical protein
MPLCPLCSRNTMQRDDFWCFACGKKLNAHNEKLQRQARMESLQISPASISFALRIMDKMQQPKLLTGPPPVLMLTLEPANRKMPIGLQHELQGRLSPATNTKDKPVLANMATPLPMREAAWKVAEDARVAELRKEVDRVESHLKEQLAKHEKYLKEAGKQAIRRTGVASKADWLTLPDLDRIDLLIDAELKKTKLRSEQNLDGVIALQREAVEYLKGVEDCIPICQTIGAFFDNDPDAKSDFDRRYQKVKSFINTGPAAKNAWKMSQVTMLKREVARSVGMRLLWKDALDKIDKRLAYMVSEDGFKMKGDGSDVQKWNRLRVEIATLVKRNPLDDAVLNKKLAVLNGFIETEAKEKEIGRQNSLLNEGANTERQNLPRLNGVGGAVTYSSLSAEKKALAKALKHNKPIPANWERRPHHSHPGGNGSEYRLWSGPVGAPGSVVGGLRMTSASGRVYQCSAHNSTSKYDYLPVVGIPSWDPHPPLPADFPAAPANVALLPL